MELFYFVRVGSDNKYGGNNNNTHYITISVAYISLYTEESDDTTLLRLSEARLVIALSSFKICISRRGIRDARTFSPQK